MPEFAEAELSGESLSPEELEKIFSFADIPAKRWRFPGAIVRRAYRPGELIVRQGEHGTTAFYLLSGKVQVSTDSPISAIRSQKGGRHGLLGSITKLIKLVTGSAAQALHRITARSAISITTRARNGTATGVRSRIFWADEKEVLRELVDTVARTPERQVNGKHRHSRVSGRAGRLQEDSESFLATVSELSENRTGYRRRIYGQKLIDSPRRLVHDCNYTIAFPLRAHMKAALLAFTAIGILSIPGLAQEPQFIGAGGCSSSNCHGATSPSAPNVSRIMGHEYSVWSVRDKHSQAYSVLSNDRSKRMAQILGIADATKATECLDCHAAGSPGKSLSDGVACEACHGPAEKWLGPHVTEGQTHAQNVSLGMTDTKNLETRARMCLDCHVGDSRKKVDHRFIAAGHPDLPFELDTFSAALPMHWRPAAPSAGNTLPSLRAFAIGQAAALSKGMEVLANAAGLRWPEFAELECYQCHHDLRRDSWRIARGYPGRTPGGLLPNVSRFTVLRVVAAQAAGDRSPALNSALDGLVATVAGSFGDASAVAQAAGRVKSEADALGKIFSQRNFTEADGIALAKALGADIGRISGDGVQAAEQATMAIDAIVAAVAPEGVVLRENIRKLYDYLEHPSTYRPAEFAQLFRAVVRQLS